MEFDFSELPKNAVDPEQKKAALQKIAKTFQHSFVFFILVTDRYLHQNENEKERTKAGVAYLFKKLYF